MSILVGAFWSFFRSQQPAARRQLIADRVAAIADNDPDLAAIRDALPADVRDAFDLMIDIARKADWNAR